MSKGTPIRSVRLSDQLWVEIQFQVMSLRVHSPKKEWTPSTFIEEAIKEKLKKMRRSREHPGRRKRLTGAVLPNLHI
jgi:hypothetical protein